MYVIVEQSDAGAAIASAVLYMHQETAERIRDRWQSAADESCAPVQYEVCELRKIGS